MFTRYAWLFVFIPLVSCSQDHRATSKTSWHRLGEDSVSVTVSNYGGRKQLVYINLHDDENSSLQATLPFLKKHGGVLLKINNQGKRNIRFTLDGLRYEFDPNRIFSRNGIVHTLVRHKRISNRAVDEIDSFARFLLNLVPEQPEFVIALHNNIDGKLSIDSYIGDGEESADAAEVTKNSSADPDDFMLTTERPVYLLFREKFNIILQDNDHARQDGSLSIYFGEKNIPYLNCETQHGHVTQYRRMLQAVHNSLDRIRAGL